jgi:predicted Zn-dependent peptidase
VIELSDLDCGARLVTEPMAQVASVAVGFFVAVGSRDEDDAHAGASHFLEHLLFKGTPRRQAAEIARAIDRVGGDMNAYTTKEYTAFYVRLLADDLPLGLEILTDIVTDPALRPEELEAEREVILDELRLHADEPSDVAVEQCMAGLFPGHPLGRDVLGTEQSVRALTRAELAGFFERHYRPSNFVVAAAGMVDHETLGAELERALRSRGFGVRPERCPPEAREEPLMVASRPTEQANLAIGMRTVGRRDEARYALALVNHVLGGGVSSRLFQEVRERRGLAYSVWSERSLFEEVGALVVGVGTAPDKLATVAELVHHELDRLGMEGVSEEELALAKRHLRAEALLGHEDSGRRMARLGSSLLAHSEVLEFEEVIARIEAVDAKEVASLSEQLAAAPRVVSVVGPFERGQLESLVRT